MTSGSLPRDYFEALYDRDPDPWRFRTSDYERAKYADTLAALEGRRFGRAVEVGCSIGELTAHLAPACDDLLAVDIAEAPLAIARRRNAELAHIHFVRMALPGAAPDGPFDLIVLSEVLYYLGDEDLFRLAHWVQGALAPGGVVLLVHWLGETPDYPTTGEAACEAFIAASPGLTIDRQWRRERYRMDRLRTASRAAPATAGPA